MYLAQIMKQMVIPTGNQHVLFYNPEQACIPFLLIIACDFLVTVGYPSETAYGLEPKEACYKIKWR